MSMTDELAGATRIFFQSPAGKEVMDRLLVKRHKLLEAASEADKETGFALLKEAMGVKSAITVLNTIMSMDKTKKGGRTQD